MRLKLGLTLGSSDVAIVDRGASWRVAGERRNRFSLLPPAPPPQRTALGCGGLLTLTLRGKAMDGFEEQQERNRPQLSPPSLENRRTDAGFPQRQQAGGAPSRGFARPLLFTTNGTYNRQQSDAGNTINPSTKSGQAHTLVVPLAVDSLDELRVIAGAEKAVAQLCGAGFVCPVVTVQSRIAKGAFSEVEFRGWFRRLASQMPRANRRSFGEFGGASGNVSLPRGRLAF